MTLHGALVLDKPRGITSFKALKIACRALGERTAGHAGTLDPMASGVLVVLLGEAMKLSALVMDHDKSYDAEVTLGVATDTLDAEGVVSASRTLAPGEVTAAAIVDKLQGFIGDVAQAPPRFSALKSGGETHMSRARRGEDFEVPARMVRCHGIALTDFVDGPAPVARLRVDTGRGYYVRSFARDLGAALGVPAHLSGLRRLRVGRFDLTHAVAPDAAAQGVLIPLPEIVPDLPVVAVTAGEAYLLKTGRRIGWPEGTGRAEALALDPSGVPVALVERWEADEGRVEMRVRRGFSGLDADRT